MYPKTEKKKSMYIKPDFEKSYSIEAVTGRGPRVRYFMLLNYSDYAHI